MLLSLTGPSGVGKTTVARELISHSSNYKMITSYTTRTPRGSDIEGEYAYVTAEEFQTMFQKGAFLWKAEHGGNFYGTTAASVTELFQQPEEVGMMILVPQVISQLRDFLTTIGKESEHLAIFIEPPQKEVLLKRILKRGDDRANAERRLNDAALWQTEAHTSRIPYHFVGSDGSIQDTLTAIRALLP